MKSNYIIRCIYCNKEYNLADDFFIDEYLDTSDYSDFICDCGKVLAIETNAIYSLKVNTEITKDWNEN